VEEEKEVRARPVAMERKNSVHHGEMESPLYGSRGSWCASAGWPPRQQEEQEGWFGTSGGDWWPAGEEAGAGEAPAVLGADNEDSEVIERGARWNAAAVWQQLQAASRAEAEARYGRVQYQEVHGGAHSMMRHFSEKGERGGPKFRGWRRCASHAAGRTRGLTRRTRTLEAGGRRACQPKIQGRQGWKQR
jgi:hypothetical protein